MKCCQKTLHAILLIVSTSANAEINNSAFDFKNIQDYLVYSDGEYIVQKGLSIASQCHSNPKAAEMMAVSKLSKFLTGSTINSEERFSLDSNYTQNVTSETKSFRPKYMVVTSTDFDGYYCLLVATKDKK